MFVALPCDAQVVAQWAQKLAPLCDETEETCQTWLAAFLTAVRLERCEHLPDESERLCGHADAQVGWHRDHCPECHLTMMLRQGHTEAGVFWTAGEVMDRATRRR